MKIRILSDLHLEGSNISQIQFKGEDAIVLAGDISAYPELLVEFFERKVPQNIPVFYVLGNHEHEYQHFRQAGSFYKDLLKEFPHVTLLCNESCVFQGVEFIGSTLWSNFEGEGPSNKDALKDWVAKIADFKRIKSDFDYITPDEMEQACNESVRYLAQAIEASKAEKQVVITHFAPHLNSVSDRFKNSGIGAGYWVNDLECLLGKTCLHVHGHVHDSKDYQVGNTRVVCNPRGYSKMMDLSENPSFSVDFFVEI